MDRYRIIDLRTQALTIITLEQAAELAEVAADELAWAVEFEGICETDLHVIAAVDEPATLRCAGPSTAPSSPALSRRGEPKACPRLSSPSASAARPALSFRYEAGARYIDIAEFIVIARSLDLDPCEILRQAEAEG